jgi:thiomorpholine-carboxylate dehydrogenase
LVFTESDVRRLLSRRQLLPCLKDALIAYSRGEVRQPVRSVVPVPEHEGRWGIMPAVWGEFMGVKLVTVFEGNASRNMPTHQATIQLFSAITGEPLAMMDGRLITEMRTAAASAIATDLLASRDVASLAVLGSGVQARSHLQALAQVRQFRDIRVWSRTPANATRLAEEVGGRTTGLEEAIRGADVVVSVASTPTPIVHGEWLAPQALVNAVGAVGLHRRELDDAAMQTTVVVESREAAMRESGDIVYSGAKIYAELGELLAGTVPLPPPGRVVYKSLGIAIEDLAVALLVYKAAG